MKILISGASGLVGSHLIPILTMKGYDVFKLVTGAPNSSNEIEWNSSEGFTQTESARLEGFDAIIHLAGESVASGKWSEEKKRRIYESRVTGTKVLVDALKSLRVPPKIFISASAIGFYGNRGDEILTEYSPKGEGYFPDTCLAWEDAAQKAEAFARVVKLRFGVILASNGGVVEKMRLPFTFGVGGTVGTGNQYMSWIAIDDVIGIINFALENEISGVFNSTAPKPVTNHEFTKTFGKTLHRPTIFRVPEFTVKLFLGEMGETILLQGCRVFPKRLEDVGYNFEFKNLDAALAQILV